MGESTAYIVVAAGLWLVSIVLVYFVVRRSSVSADLHRSSEERLAAAIAQIMDLQAAVGACEVRAAVEETRASRLEVVELSLSRHEEMLAEAKRGLAEAERELATSVEARRGQTDALDATKAALAVVEDELRGARLLVDKLKDEKADLDQRLSAATTLAAQERKQGTEKLELLENARERMSLEFKSLAHAITADHSETFKNQNREQVEALLTPLREKIAEFQQGLATAHVESGKERVTLGEQVRLLMAHGDSMAKETLNLTRALKGNVRMQGAWGEMILEAILERSGLTEGNHYTLQGSVSDDDGRRLRPDVLLHLPGEQTIVIDSKVSLSAFEGFVNAEDDEARNGHLGRHRGSVKAHIDGLAAKDYAGATGSRLGCVVMFVPIEGALSAALTGDPELATYAAEKNVAIATPITLLMMLKTVFTVWRAEQRNVNAEEIARRAGLLYDKFHGFAADLMAVGKCLDTAKTSYEQAYSKLATGGGNVVWQVQKLKEMGAKTNKTLPQAMLAASSDDDACVTEATSA